MGLPDQGRERRKAQYVGVDGQFETFSIVQRLQKCCSHLVQDKATDQASKHTKCMLGWFTDKTNFDKDAQDDSSEFGGGLTPFRAVGGSCTKGCRRQTGIFQRIIAHRVGHGAQRGLAAFSFDVAFDTSSQSLIAFYSKDAPHFRDRRDLIREIKFHFRDKVGSNFLIPAICVQKKIVNFHTHGNPIVSWFDAPGIGSPQFAFRDKWRAGVLRPPKVEELR